ncbi:TonB-dependent receptor domain-containing protein [Elizabethkingia anophelis]|uniref:TonB-dependent receptor domain-containing protein n=1 Tax=Elizabethkingia anophelis TaxID=1117645 RepID=UPI0038929727
MNKKLFLASFLLTYAGIFAQKTKQNSDRPETFIDQVVITGSGYKQKIKNTPASISVITQEDIKKRSYRDMTDVLQDVPGVFITGGGSSSDFSIRGAEAGHTLVLIDGKRVNSRETRPNSDGPGIEQGWMPPVESIERIEVIKGPMSSLYGSDAMGGVINIITKKKTQATRGSIGTNLIQQTHRDMGNTYQTDAYVSGPLNKYIGYKLTGNYSHREEDKLTNGFSERNIKNVGAEINVTPTEKDIFKLEYNYNRQERYQRPGMSIPLLDRKGKPNVPSYNVYDRNAFSLSHGGTYKNFNTNSYVQYDKTKNPNRDMDYSTLIFNTLNNFNWNKHVISFGGEYRFEDLRDGGNQLEINGNKLNKLTRWNWSLFAEANWKVFPRLNFVTGARLDNDQNYGANFTPRGYLIWNATDNFTVKGGVSAGYKAPGLRAVAPGWGQVTGGGVSNGVIIGNADLKPEKSFNQELTVMYETSNKVFSASVTGYNTDFKNKLVEERKCTSTNGDCEFMGEYFDFISTRLNVGKARMRGLEATMAVNITKDLNLKANYSFTETEVRSNEVPALYGKPTSRLPKHMVNANLSWKTTDRLELWSRLNYRSKTSLGISRGSLQDTPIPDYYLIDLGTVYKFRKNVSFTFGIYNLFDRYIASDTTYGFRIDGLRYQVGTTFSF